MGMLGSGPIRPADIVNRLLPDLEMMQGVSNPLTVPDAKLHLHQGPSRSARMAGAETRHIGSLAHHTPDRCRNETIGRKTGRHNTARGGS